MIYKGQMKTKMIMTIIVMHPAFPQCLNLNWLQYPAWLAMLLIWCKRKLLVLHACDEAVGSREQLHLKILTRICYILLSMTTIPLH